MYVHLAKRQKDIQWMPERCKIQIPVSKCNLENETVHTYKGVLPPAGVGVMIGTFKCYYV
jgi:hypothetical protein